ncbi:hypothetical protein D9M71_720350 [compost metagenome]
MIQLHVFEPKEVQGHFVEVGRVLLGQAVAAQVQPPQVLKGCQAIDVGGRK